VLDNLLTVFLLTIFSYDVIIDSLGVARVFTQCLFVAPAALVDLPKVKQLGSDDESVKIFFRIVVSNMSLRNLSSKKKKKEIESLASRSNYGKF